MNIGIHGIRFLYSVKNRYLCRYLICAYGKIRFSALEELARCVPVERKHRPRLTEVYGADVFTMEKMRHYLSVEAFRKLEKSCRRVGLLTAHWQTRWLPR